MYNDRQPLDCLNLSVKYVSHWTYLQGLRELYQNFMDACVEKYPEFKILHRKQVGNKITFTQAKRVGNQLQLIEQNYICYDKDAKTLTMQNEKSFPVKCLLMGCSEKGPEALGQFGEGMKVSMIVLLKADLDIIIESGENIYYPTLKSWDHNPVFEGKYEHNVLYVKVQPKENSDKTKVTISNVNQAKFEQFLYLSLALLDQSKYEKITFGPSTLIFPNDPKLIGKVYKKGVRLELHESKNSVKFQHYSYDLDTVQVGRERDCVNNVWDLYRLQSQLHYNVMCKLLDNKYLSDNPHMRPKLKAHLSNIYGYMKVNNYQTHFLHEYTSKNKPLTDLIYQKFMEENGDVPQIYPLYGNAKSDLVTALYMYGLQSSFYPGVDASWLQWNVLVHSTKYMSIGHKIEEEIVKKQVRDLTPEEAERMKPMINKVCVLCPEIAEYTLKSKMLKDIYCCKDKNISLKIIYINPDKIGEEQKLARSLAKMLLA